MWNTKQKLLRWPDFYGQIPVKFYNMLPDHKMCCTHYAIYCNGDIFHLTSFVRDYSAEQTWLICTPDFLHNVGSTKLMFCFFTVDFFHSTTITGHQCFFFLANTLHNAIAIEMQHSDIRLHDHFLPIRGFGDSF